MVNELKINLEKLQKLKQFKDYRKKNSDAYLCAAFTIIEPSKKTDWQIDYYSPKSDKMTTFSTEPKIEKKECQTLHRDSNKVHELNLENIDVGFDETLNIVTNLKNRNYPGEKTNKIIIILQSINKKEVWNVTYLTNSFKVLNVHVDAQNGEILNEKIENILNFKTK